MRHSWLIYFKYGTQFKFPNWFQEWWNCLSQTKNTFIEQSIFFSKWCISWFVSWNYSYK
ncbi:hypothetical protein Gotur_012376 [Gossypium turneri]